MGDRRVCDSPPAISWQSYSSSALLETVQEITKVLQERVAAPGETLDLWILLQVVPQRLH